MAPSPPFSVGSRLQEHAAAFVSRELADQPNRLAHTKGVVRAAAGIARALRRSDDGRWGRSWGDQLITAAWVHDIGYSKHCLDTGFHAIDGARFLMDTRFAKLAWVVAHHTGAANEAAARGLSCSEFAIVDSVLLDCLSWADLTTGPTGERVSMEERVADICKRYPSDHPAHVSCIQGLTEFRRIGSFMDALDDPGPRLPNVVAIDVDGTLLASDSTLSQTTIEVMSSFARTGGSVVLASGKHPRSIYPQASAFGAPGPHIACNGSIVCGFGSITRCDVLGCLDEALALSVLAELELLGLDAAVFTPETIGSVAEADMTPLDAIGEASDTVMDLGEFARMNTVLKVLSVLPSSADQAIEARLRAVFEGMASVQRTGRTFLEFGPLGVSKGRTLEALVAERTQAPFVVAFGDAENDLPLFYDADWAVAVANASDIVKDAADEVCGSNDDNGPVRWIREWMER